MSDPSTPDFTVTDRRHAASENGQPSEDNAEDAVAPDSQPEKEAQETEPSAPLFDPAALVTFGAMQVETRLLAQILLTVFDQHAWTAMGLLANPRTGETETDLPAAQLAIDTVHFLLSKVENDLTETERRDAYRRLNDLRMNYLSKKQAQQG
jgi:hypothetical protein